MIFLILCRLEQTSKARAHFAMLDATGHEFRIRAGTGCFIQMKLPWLRVSTFIPAH